MITIGITGINGLIGTHFKLYFSCKEHNTVIGANRDTFKSYDKLIKFVSEADVILHLAGKNRGNDDDIVQTNISLTKDLVRALKESGQVPHVLFSSSTQIVKDNAYSRSKRECTTILEEWSGKTGGRFSNLVMPHIFGEWGKPFYNSVVSTFCYQLANNEKPVIQNDGDLELLYTQKLAADIHSIIDNKEYGDIRLTGEPIKVSELLDKLLLLSRRFKKISMSDLKNNLDLYLFRTYCSYLFPDHYSITTDNVPETEGEQINIDEGKISGNHYNSLSMKRIYVCHGSALLKTRKLFTEDIYEFELNDNKKEFVDVPIFHTYSISNTGNGKLIILSINYGLSKSDSQDIYSELV